MTPSFIPIVCLDCGEKVSRKSEANPRMVCTGCQAEFVMLRIKNGSK